MLISPKPAPVTPPPAWVLFVAPSAPADGGGGPRRPRPPVRPS